MSLLGILAEKSLKTKINDNLPEVLQLSTTKVHVPGQIDNLKANIAAAGHQSPSRFKIVFTPPNGLIGKYPPGSIALDLITKYSFSVGIPVASYLTYDWVSKGVPIKLPYQKGYSDLTTNHYVDAKNIVRSFFQDWHELVMDNDTNNFNYYEDYTGSVLIHQYANSGDSTEDITATWFIDYLWPTILGQESLAFDSNDQMTTFDVTWAYNILQLTKRQ